MQILTPTRLDLQRMRRELRERLCGYHFDHFVTLATNGDAGIERMRGFLRRWDAEMNRFLVGRRWTDRPDDRMLWFAFPEKVGVNSHWHLLVQLDPAAGAAVGPGRRRERALEFADRGQRAWSRACHTGTFNCQPIVDEGALKYATKVLDDAVNLEGFVLSREFQTT
jgi:hypothetical protein